MMGFLKWIESSHNHCHYYMMGSYEIGRVTRYEFGNYVYFRVQSTPFAGNNQKTFMRINGESDEELLQKSKLFVESNADKFFEFYNNGVKMSLLDTIKKQAKKRNIKVIDDQAHIKELLAKVGLADDFKENCDKAVFVGNDVNAFILFFAKKDRHGKTRSKRDRGYVLYFCKTQEEIDYITLAHGFASQKINTRTS